MCLYGNYKLVKIINKNQNKTEVLIDICIAEEIGYLNLKGVVTIGCCCGHGETGISQEYENSFGRWKTIEYPPHALIDKDSADLCEELGYRVYPYYYADGNMLNTRLIYLKSGCLDMKQCEHWHEVNGLPFVKNLGILN